VRLWDWRHDDPVQVLSGHEDVVSGAVFSPDRSTVLSFSADETVRLWQVATGRELRSFRHDGRVLDAAFSHDGKWIVSAGDDYEVRVWDVDSGARQHTLPGHATTVAFSPDDKMVLTGVADGSVTVWDAASGTRLSLLERHSGVINSVSFNPAGDLILSVSDDHTAKVYPCEVCGDHDELLALAEKRLRYVRDPAPRSDTRSQ
jgi:WD40 repeat protein